MMKEYLDVDFEIKSEDVQEDGIFVGYGSTFGGAPDSYGDIIKQGAFLESLNKGGRNGYGIAMLWQHKADKIPGKWISLEENSKGLKVKGQLALNTQLGKEAYELLKMGAIQGLSIGFNVSKDGSVFDSKKRTRTITKANLWEISLVTFPANIRAKINSVKALEEITSERELEAFLRESGLSKQVSLVIVKMCKPYLSELDIKENEASNDSEQIEDEIISNVVEEQINTVEKADPVAILNLLKEDLKNLKINLKK